MSKFVVSARKYRPGTFDSVVGQSHITNTLKNAIKNDHLAHAFLFCGPRGVGKTTCARILAKAINCENIGDDFEPCGECGSCKSFQDGASLNIYELDAASNNHVDDIRHLTEQVRYMPQAGKYKIYIIDEVHMLSTAAFNAFLKTLEEPPSYAIFILATTEKHKIIPTILSRCQIFDFHRIQVEDTTKHLEGICKNEGIDAERDALHIISQKADGALRDALSIFDRIVSFSGDKITYKDVIDNLNILDYDYFFRVTDALLGENVSQGLKIFDEILRKGFDGDDFILGLSEHFRNLLVCKDKNTLELLELTDSLKERYVNQASITPSAMLVNSLDVCNQCDINYKLSKNKRLHVEMAIIKMCFSSAALKQNFSIAVSDQKKKSSDGVSAGASSNKIFPQSKVAPTSVAPKDFDASAPKVEAKPEDPTAVNKAPKPKVEKPVVNTKKAPSFKLSSLKKKTQEEVVEEKKVEVKDDAVAENISIHQDHLTKAWGNFGKKLKYDGNDTFLYSLVSTTEPKVKEHNVFIVKVRHAIEQERLVEHKMEVLQYLRQEINVPSLIMEIEIDETLDGKGDQLYTSRDKFKKLVEKNENLLHLKDKLDLDLDF